MEHWLTDIINEYGYMGILFLIALENIFPPVPSEVILTFGGFATTTSGLTIGGVVAASTVGSVLGAIVLYVIGLQLDVERLEKIVDRYGHVLRITRKDIHRADAWFDKYGPWTVFLCRFVPLIRSLISIPAGMSNMNFGLFLLFTTLGTLIWNVVLIYLGASVGSSWDTIVEYMDLYSKFVYVLLAILFVALIFLYIKKRRKK
ncbi:membrane protein DedA with SNARE-associated domain [Bacillus tianshenii]|uniref:Membrane protein DedA with SNARE-associated domain n=1 Tax=Sutcliffiella tianshenii TaxID=1463404 RepID=A0ABS2NUY7_9BACI|nr:DedA family protein [Bacillus tianshenii]MBM7618476.1 membrane protein DedA with SNARE-associated domain [Bacillus tianshenii]